MFGDFFRLLSLLFLIILLIVHSFYKLQGNVRPFRLSSSQAFRAYSQQIFQHHYKNKEFQAFFVAVVLWTNWFSLVSVFIHILDMVATVRRVRVFLNAQVCSAHLLNNPNSLWHPYHKATHSTLTMLSCTKVIFERCFFFIIISNLVKNECKSEKCNNHSIRKQAHRAQRSEVS